ncbi:MAG: PIG-L family deacetylase [Candidatus Dadabacteria bacterium]|nr:PIG-L family deacetylase [Candidatus Dadabacteria bacterium]NIQ13033.1 PIG-L family deacetylase [Candidatus Dadabacteria bacterium]
MSSKNVLIISPHPDDLEIGMGGTVAKLVSEGANVVSFVVTDGRNSTNNLGISGEELAAVRKNEVEKSSKILGISRLISLGLSEIKSEENMKYFSQKLSQFFSDFKPNEIYIPHPEIDKHKTHNIISKIVLETIKNNNIKCLCWCYEVWSSFPFYDRLEDITNFADKKALAINQHKSQLSYKDYTKGIMGLNKYRAVFNDFYKSDDIEFAEVFIKFN